MLVSYWNIILLLFSLFDLNDSVESSIIFAEILLNFLLWVKGLLLK